MFRQGDVLIRPVASIPDGLKKVPLDKGRVILAYGEVTGHAHAVIGDVEFLAADLEEMEQRFLRVEASQEFEVPVFGEQKLVGHTKERIVFETGEIQEMGEPIFKAEQAGTEMVPGAQIVHEEHATVTLPPGEYEVIRQREYAPEAPQWVAD